MTFLCQHIKLFLNYVIVTGIRDSVVTCKFEVHFQESCQDSQVAHFYSFQPFCMILPGFVSWEETPFAFCSDSVAASGCTTQNLHLLEGPFGQLLWFHIQKKRGSFVLQIHASCGDHEH